MYQKATLFILFGLLPVYLTAMPGGGWPVCDSTGKANAGNYVNNTTCANPSTFVNGFYTPPFLFQEIVDQCDDVTNNVPIEKCKYVEICFDFVAEKHKITDLNIAMFSTCSSFPIDTSETFGYYLFDSLCTQLDSIVNTSLTNGSFEVLSIGTQYTICVKYRQRDCEVINMYPCFVYADTGVYIYPLQDWEVCNGDVFELTYGQVVTGGTPPYAYQWSPSTNLNYDTVPNPMVLANDTTTYVLTVTDALNNTDTDTLVVYGNPPISPWVNNDTLICKGDSVQLNASGGSWYNWFPSHGLSAINISNPKASPDSSITYGVIVAASNPGCFDTTFVTVSVEDFDVNAVANEDLLCDANSVQLNALVNSKLWDDFNGGYQAGLWLQVTGAMVGEFCGATDGDALYFNDSGQRSAVTNPLDVSNGGVLQFDLYIADGPGPCDEPEAGEFVRLAYSVDGGITWTMADTFDLDSFPVMTTVVWPIPPAAQSSTTLFYLYQSIHSGFEMDIWMIDNFYVGDDPANYTFNWKPVSLLNNPNIANPVALLAGTTDFEVIVTGNVCSDTSEVNVALGQSPIADAGPDTLICEGDTVPLFAFFDPAYSYLWNTPIFMDDPLSATPLVWPPDSTHYVLSVTDTASGCMAQDTVLVDVDDDCVWPGDANSDGVVNNGDLLPIGLGYGLTGPIRPNASIMWESQPAFNWNGMWLNGANYKHADCNGDGLISELDTAAIVANYLLMHVKTSTGKQGPLDSALYIEFTTDSVLAGDTAHANIVLGDQVPITVYGLAFSINYDPALVDSASAKMDYTNSWLGTVGTDMITLERDLYQLGRIDVGMTRTNQMNVTGNGIIAKISIVMQDDISGKRMGTAVLPLAISGVTIINNAEDTLPIFQGSDSIVVYEKTTQVANGLLPAAAVKVFPNPANQQCQLQSKVPITGVRLYNLIGDLVWTNTCVTPSHQLTFSTAQLPAGVYLLHLTTEKGNCAQKLSILH